MCTRWAGTCSENAETPFLAGCAQSPMPTMLENSFLRFGVDCHVHSTHQAMVTRVRRVSFAFNRQTVLHL
jgi:hypothetical protein